MEDVQNESSAQKEVEYLDLNVSEQKLESVKENKEEHFRLLDELYQQDSTDLLNNSEFMTALVNVERLTLANSKLSCDWALKYNLAPVFIKCLQDAFSILKAETARDPEAKITHDMSVLLAPRCCINAIRSYSNKSAKFAQQCINQNAVDLVLKYLKTEALINAYIDSVSSETISSKTLKYIVRGAIGCLVNMSKVYTETKEKWTSSSELGNKTLMSWLLLLNKKLKNIDDCELAICILIAFIADDQELANSRTSSEFKEVISQLAQIIGTIGKQLSSKSEKKTQRVKTQIKENGPIVSVTALTINKTQWHLIELLSAMYKLAINDQIKQDIYGECKMGKHLKNIIMHGNEVEREYAISLLWQLCFDKNIANEVKVDIELLEKLLSESGGEDLMTKCDGLLWLLTHNDPKVDDHESQDIEIDNSSEKKKKEEDKHIMISYNRESRDLCLQVKHELEAMGHKVWIDVEGMHGSSLEAMAHAIEKSKCVLVCMTEKYKQSANCRAEAEYVFQLGKPFIPLIMQKSYKPDGWLGIILGSKIFIDFMKYEYQECVRRLKGELHNLNFDKIDSQTTTTTTIAPPPPNQAKQPEALLWSEKRVDEWMKEKRVHKLIRKNVAPCEGKVLAQMYSMLTEAPEFFYKSISAANSSAESDHSVVSTKDVALFALELKTLFSNK